MKLFNYSYEDTIIHRLSGLTKLLCFMMLTGIVMYTYDIRIFAFILIFSFTILRIAHISIKSLRLIFIYVGIFLAINFVLSFVFDPNFGPKTYGSSTVIFPIAGRYVVTREQLFYQVSKLFKYSSVIPLGILFLFTTDPSEFASSLNAIFIPYKITYAVALTLRHFPDVQKEYTTISKAQQARGLDISRRTSFRHRFGNAVATMVPLIFSSLARIDVITNAMHLRGFSKHSRRTWYTFRPLKSVDFIALAICLMTVAGAIGVAVFVNHGRFYNPFN
ncbi:MAG: energy-coupling factor transporter transmembrane component T [Spirochaetaceae bacterium]|nr:energy-coupling factor transporter transmembrane component T [Spirochaetaceae bacterium]